MTEINKRLKNDACDVPYTYWSLPIKWQLLLISSKPEHNFIIIIWQHVAIDMTLTKGNTSILFSHLMASHVSIASKCVFLNYILTTGGQDKIMLLNDISW